MTDNDLRLLGFGVSMAHGDYSRWSNQEVSVILSKERDTITQLGLVTGRDDSLNMPVVHFINVIITDYEDLKILLDRLS